jgi:hypothetical protein
MGIQTIREKIGDSIFFLSYFLMTLSLILECLDIWIHGLYLLVIGALIFYIAVLMERCDRLKYEATIATNYRDYWEDVYDRDEQKWIHRLAEKEHQISMLTKDLEEAEKKLSDVEGKVVWNDVSSSLPERNQMVVVSNGYEYFLAYRSFERWVCINHDQHDTSTISKWYYIG